MKSINISPFTILLVDDNAMYINMLKTWFELSGISSILAENAEKALESMKKQIPDLILTDLHMPEIDGLELANMIRDIFPVTPIIMLTSDRTPEVDSLAMSIGISRVLDKSISPAEILRIVKEEVANGKMRRDALSIEATGNDNPSATVKVPFISSGNSE